MSTDAFLSRYPVRASLSLVQGDSWDRLLEFQSLKDQSIIDTEGWYCLLQIRDKAGALIYEASTANGRVTTGLQGEEPDQYNGLVISIPALDTASMTDWGVGKWQLDAGPNVTRSRTWFGGDAWLIPDTAF